MAVIAHPRLSTTMRRRVASLLAVVLVTTTFSVVNAPAAQARDANCLSPALTLNGSSALALITMHQTTPDVGGAPEGPRPPIAPPTCEPDPDVPWTEGLHAHNDYENEHALQDALDHGATSVEVDVHLDDNGSVVVKHLPDDPVRGTLTDLYVNPLNERAQQNGGPIYPGRPESFQVLLEIKEPREDLDGDGVTEYEEVYEKAIAELEGLPAGTRVVVDYPGETFTRYGEQPTRVYFTITPQQIEDDPATPENERGCAIPRGWIPAAPSTTTRTPRTS